MYFSSFRYIAFRRKTSYFDVFDDGFDFLVVRGFVFRQTQHRHQLVVCFGPGPDGHEQHQQVHAVCGREQIAVDGIAKFLDRMNTKRHRQLYMLGKFYRSFILLEKSKYSLTLH